MTTSSDTIFSKQSSHQHGADTYVRSVDYWFHEILFNINLVFVQIYVYTVYIHSKFVIFQLLQFLVCTVYTIFGIAVEWWPGQQHVCDPVECVTGLVAPIPGAVHNGRGHLTGIQRAYRRKPHRQRGFRQWTPAVILKITTDRTWSHNHTYPCACSDNHGFY